MADVNSGNLSIYIIRWCISEMAAAACEGCLLKMIFRCVFKRQVHTIIIIVLNFRQIPICIIRIRYIEDLLIAVLFGINSTGCQLISDDFKCDIRWVAVAFKLNSLNLTI